MKSVALLFAVIALAAVPAMADGEAGFFGTWASFDQADGAFGLGVRVGWNLTPALVIDFGATIYDNGKLEPSSGYTGDISASPLDLGLKFGFAGGLYLGAGVSYVYFDTDNLHLDEEVGYYARLGYERIGSRGWGWFAEAMYRDFEADVGDIVDMSGAGAAVGAKFKW